MGRGRSKAKQTKVARDLKYSNQDMDLESLADLLINGGHWLILTYDRKTYCEGGQRYGTWPFKSKTN